MSSGAIAIGSSLLGINKRRARLEDLQAAAAAGQVQLVHAYQEMLGQYGIAAVTVSSILASMASKSSGVKVVFLSKS